MKTFGISGFFGRDGRIEEPYCERVFPGENNYHITFSQKTFGPVSKFELFRRFYVQEFSADRDTKLHELVLQRGKLGRLYSLH